MRLTITPLLVLADLIVTCAFPARAELSTNRSQLIRLDELLSKATVEAASPESAAYAAEPVAWSNFFALMDVHWRALRGKLGIRNGDLMLTGGGSTPVIAPPEQPAIDFSLYKTLEIRMSATEGQEIKIKIGPVERKQKLGPAGQYNVYRFDLDLDRAVGTKPLAMMPTDNVNALVAIHSIKLIPKSAEYDSGFGMARPGKHDEYRQAIYVHSPAIISFPVTVPPNAVLRFGMGTGPGTAKTAFRITVEGDLQPLLAKDVVNNESWQDASVGLQRFSGKNVRLRLETATAHTGDIAFWSTPVITSAGKHSPPNIVVYMIDTLRADHSSVYGYKRDTTPFLKKLASTGVVFDDCQSQATWTKPSVASLMTSLYAFTHGIISESDTIPAGSVTLASELQKAGYVTASIVSSPFAGRTTGLDRGFDYMVESPAVTNRVTPEEQATDSAALNRVVFPWLDRHRDEPFFLYAHSTDPHAPYNAPAKFESVFAKPSETPRFEREYSSFRSSREHGGGVVISPEMCKKAGINPEQFLEEAEQRYDAKILNNDRNFEQLVEKLKQLGVLNNTLIVVVSDHGEEFWDHGWTAHGQSVYQELTHTFLLMWNPGLLPHPKRVSEPVQVIDVMPSLLEAAGLKAPELIQGQSLLPLAKGTPFSRRGMVISSKFAVPDPDHDIVPENKVDSFAIIDGHWKFIFRNHTSKAPGIKRVELYDRTKDRSEQNDLAAGHPQEIEKYMGALRSWIDAQNQVRTVVGHPGRSTLDRQTLERLRSLGYIGGTE